MRAASACATPPSAPSAATPPIRAAAQAVCKARYLEFGCEGQGGKLKPQGVQLMAAKYAKGELAQLVH